MANDLVKFAERMGKDTDLAFVYSSWLRSRPEWPEMRTDDFNALQHQRIERLLASGRLMVLHPEGAPDVIASWALLDEGAAIAHYVHTRNEYRRKDCATRLLTGRTIVTHMTEQGARLKRKLGLRYMPHLLDG